MGTHRRWAKDVRPAGSDVGTSSSPMFEALEPRLLLSATALSGGLEEMMSSPPGAEIRQNTWPGEDAEQAAGSGTLVVQATGSDFFSRADDVAIPDLADVWYDLSVSGIPGGAVITNVTYRARIPHTFVADLNILLVSANSTTVNIWNNVGGATDGGNDDDAEDDYDIYLNNRTTSSFDGEDPNGTWSLHVQDQMSLDTGNIDYLELTIDYETSGTADLFDDGDSWNDFSPTTVTPGDAFSAGLRVRNGGTADAGEFWVEFYASTDSTITTSDYLLGLVSVPGVTAGNNANVDLNTTFPSGIPAGNYYVGTIIDSTDSITESAESNNYNAFDEYPLTVAPAAMSLSFTGPPGATYCVGERLLIEWVAGTVPAGTTISLGYDEDQTWANGNEHWITVDELAVATGGGSYVWRTAGVAPGTYYVMGYIYDGATTTIAYNGGAVTFVEQEFALQEPVQTTYTLGDRVPIRWTCDDVADPQSTITLGYDADGTWLNGNETWIEIDDVIAADGDGVWQWNTLRVAAGTYYLCGYMFDWAGTYTTSQVAQPITLVAPTLTIHDETDTGPYVPGDIVEIGGLGANVEPGSAISLCYDEDTTWLNGNEHWIEIDGVVVDGGSGEWMWDTTGVAAGTYYLSGYMYDWRGVYTAPTALQAVTILDGVSGGNTASPAQTFTLTAPSAGTYAIGERVLIEGTVSNVTSTTKISIGIDEDTTWLNGNEQWLFVDGMVAENGAGSYLWTTHGTAAGTYYVMGYVHDGHSNFATAYTAAAITLAEQSFDVTGAVGTNFIRGDAVTIQWTAANVPDPQTTVTLFYDEDNIWLNGNERWIEMDQVLAANGADSYDWRTVGVSDGAYYVGGYMYDWTGHAIVSYAPAPITITSPSLEITGPTGTFTVGDMVSIDWLATNALAGSSISLALDPDDQFNGDESWIEIDIVSANPGSGSYLWDSSGVSAGTYRLAGYLYDWRGVYVTFHSAWTIILAP